MRQLSKRSIAALQAFHDWTPITRESAEMVDYMASCGLLQRNESVAPLIDNIIGATVSEQRIERAVMTDGDKRRPIQYKLTKRGLRQIALNYNLYPDPNPELRRRNGNG